MLNQKAKVWLRNAIELGEQWAESGVMPPGTVEMERSLATRRNWALWSTSRVWIALECIARNGPRALGGPAEGVPTTLLPGFADGYREVFGNPFRPLAWNPHWFTSTVRDLATHIYARHEFTSMPILADALQDAGCDDEQILAHCRASRPHARGCWVLDAILSK
jgi:hypothetical protein